MFGAILWPLMKSTSTKHDDLDNFRTRGTPAFDFGVSGNSKWPIELLRYHEHDQYSFV